MRYEKVASGGVFDLANLDDYESLFAEGDQGELAIDLRLPVTDWVVDTIKTRLEDYGVQTWGGGVIQESHSPAVLKIRFVKASSPLVWIAIIVGIIAVILIIGWSLFKVIPEALQGPLLIALIAGVVLIGIGMAKKRSPT